MEAPFDIVDFDIGDVSDQIGSDLIDPVRNVQFTIKDVKVDEVKDKLNDEVLLRKINPTLVIGPLGTDGEGRLANKHLFPSILAWHNPERYTSDWWKKQARYPLKQFLSAVGVDPASPPKINDDFISSLKGKEIVGDIRVEDMQRRATDEELESNPKKKWVPTGDKKNNVVNFKSVQ